MSEANMMTFQTVLDEVQKLDAATKRFGGFVWVSLSVSNFSMGGAPKPTIFFHGIGDNATKGHNVAGKDFEDLMANAWHWLNTRINADDNLARTLGIEVAA
jgi:hypothetical protein